MSLEVSSHLYHGQVVGEKSREKLLQPSIVVVSFHQVEDGKLSQNETSCILVNCYKNRIIKSIFKVL